MMSHESVATVPRTFAVDKHAWVTTVITGEMRQCAVLRETLICMLNCVTMSCQTFSKANHVGVHGVLA